MGRNAYDRWARSESGLHLPSRFVPQAARRMHHIQKNGTAKECCACTISECWGVAVSGFSDDSCANCDILNSTWYLRRVTGTTTWTCTIPDACSECGDKTISLVFDSGAGTITVEFNGVIWTKSTTITTDSYCQSHTLSYVSNSGDCAYDESSITIVPGYNQYGACPCPLNCGSACLEGSVFLTGTTPLTLNVDFYGTTDDTCSICEDYDGTYVLEQNPSYSCAWCYNAAKICAVPSRWIMMVEVPVSTIYLRLGQTSFTGCTIASQWVYYSGSFSESLPLDGTSFDPVTLSLVAYATSFGCNWPSTATVYP